MDPYVEAIWNKPGVQYSEVVDGNLRRTEAGIQALREELEYYFRSFDPKERKHE